jgi:hypothetical protein
VSAWFVYNCACTLTELPSLTVSEGVEKPTNAELVCTNQPGVSTNLDRLTDLSILFNWNKCQVRDAGVIARLNAVCVSVPASLCVFENRFKRGGFECAQRLCHDCIRLRAQLQRAAIVERHDVLDGARRLLKQVG